LICLLNEVAGALPISGVEDAGDGVLMVGVDRHQGWTKKKKEKRKKAI